MRVLRQWMWVACAAAPLMLAGCHITSHKDGKGDNVDIGTPFGAVQVKTNDKADTSAIGITQYPGSAPVQDHDNHDAADVNLSFGKFHLGVKAASFQSADARDKVLAFYKKDLKRYGDVLECQGDSTMGTPSRTAQGLTCEQNKNANYGKVEIGDGLELRTGSPQRQHIVSLKTKDGGTLIKLVALDLPSGFGDKGDDKDSE